jgi:hypothetical protein
MPITTLATYLPTLDEFIAHWTRVNEELSGRGEAEALLADGFSLADLIRLRDEWRELESELETTLPALLEARERRSSLGTAVDARMREWREAVLPGEPQETAAYLPGPRLLGAMDSLAAQWSETDAEEER